MLSQVTGTKSVYLSEKRPEKSIIYGSGENGAFIVLPVSFTEEDQKGLESLVPELEKIFY